MTKQAKSIKRIAAPSQAAEAFISDYHTELVHQIGSEGADVFVPSDDTRQIIVKAHRSIDPGSIKAFAIRAARVDVAARPAGSATP